MAYQDPSTHESADDASPAEALSIHDQLARLMDEAQRHPLGSTPRNQAITAMYRLILQSGKVSRKWKTQPFYEEALNDTWVNFVRRLDQYDRSRGASVLTWFNQLLDWKCGDWYRQSQRDRDRTDSSQANADPLASYKTDGRTILNHFERWLQETPELTTIHLQHRPDITAYRVIHYRILDHQYPGWRDLAYFFQVEVKSLQNFWGRKCKFLLQQFWDQLSGML